MKPRGMAPHGRLPGHLMLPDHTEFADQTGWARYCSEERAGTIEYGHLPGDDRLWSDIRGCRVEMAGYLWLGGKGKARWMHYVPDHMRRMLNERPEIIYRGRFLDFKAQPERWQHDFIIKQQDLHEDWIYVNAILSHWPLVIFHSWMPGHLVKLRPIGGRKEVPGHVISKYDPDLRSCWEMLEWPSGT